jgi:hypothetical protein
MDKINTFISGKMPERFSQKNIPKPHIIVVFLVSGLFGVYLVINSFAAETPKTYYVDKDSIGGNCSDDYSLAQATSISTPWCTIGKAVNDAPSGDTVVVRGGTYPAVDVNNTSRTDYTTFVAEDDENVSVDIDLDNARYIRLKNLQMTGTNMDGDHLQIIGSPQLNGVVIQEGSSEITIEDNLITSGGTGVTFSAGTTQPTISNVTISNNLFDGIRTDAIQAKRFDGLLIEGNEFTDVRRDDPTKHPDILQTVFGGNNLIFRNNWLHDYEAQGFFIADGTVTNVIVENNLIEPSDGPYSEVRVGDNAVDISFRNNTVIGLVRFSGGTSNARIFNNIIIGTLQYDFSSGLTIAYQDYNIIGATSGSSRNTHDLEGTATFVDTAAGDYRLAAGSQGIDAGISTDAPETDKNGNQRIDTSNVDNTGGGDQPYYDIGAYEFQASLLYVDKDSIGGTCSDSHSAAENTLSTPWCSLGKAISSAPGGSKVIIRSGTYPAVDINNDVSRTAYTTFQPYSGESVTVDIDISNSQYIRLEGLKLIGDVGLLRSNHIELINNEITPDGVMVRGSTDLLLENNDIHDIRRDTVGCPSAPSLGNGYAIWLNASSDIRSERVSIKNNRIYNVTHDAIQTGSTDDLLIEGNDVSSVKAVDCGDHSDVLQIVEGRRITVRANHFHDSAHGFMVNGHGTTFRGDLRFENNLIEGITGSFGMNLYNTDGLVLANNTVWDTLLGVRLRDTTANPTVMHATIKNNIFDTYGSECDSIGCIDYQDYNLIVAGERHGEHDLSGSPSFVDSGNGNYHLAAGSQGIDAGISTDAPETDKDGSGRLDIPGVENTGGGDQPYYDVGAYEFQDEGSTPVTDTSSPTVSLTAPVDNTTVSGIISVSANASDNVGVVGVQFKVNGNNLASEDTTSPYSKSWDTTSVSNGLHTITAVARDAAGNIIESSTSTVTVNNAAQESCSGSENFICEDFGADDSRFTTSNGTWDVIGGKYVLSDPAGNPIGLNNRALHNTEVGGDFVLELDASVVSSSSIFKDFGVILNYQDSDNYYYVSFNESNDGQTSGIFKVSVGAQTELADITQPISADTIYEIKVEKIGTSINAYLGDNLLATVSDDAFDGGKVGFGSRNDPAIFDNFKITAQDSEPTPPDTTDPTISFTDPDNNETVSGIVTASVSASDDGGVDRVEFSLDGDFKLSDSTSPYNYSFDSKSLSNGEHTISAKAYDVTGNTKMATITVNVSNPDITPPSAPTNLTATATNPTTVNLSWNASTDTGSNSTGVAKYNVLRDDAVIAQVDSPTTSYTDDNLTASTGYSYEVQAVDGAENTSTSSSTAHVMTPDAPDETVPSVPGDLSAVAVNPSQINLSWSASTDEGGSGLAGYNIYRDGDKLNDSLITTITYGDATVDSSSNYDYQVEAVDGAGNVSSRTDPVNASTPLAKKGDITGPDGGPDGKIDLRDISYIIRNYNTDDATADISGPGGEPDGKVDLRDISYLIRNYDG